MNIQRSNQAMQIVDAALNREHEMSYGHTSQLTDLQIYIYIHSLVFQCRFSVIPLHFENALDKYLCHFRIFRI